MRGVIGDSVWTRDVDSDRSVVERRVVEDRRRCVEIPAPPLPIAQLLLAAPLWTRNLMPQLLRAVLLVALPDSNWIPRLPFEINFTLSMFPCDMSIPKVPIPRMNPFFATVR